MSKRIALSYSVIFLFLLLFFCTSAYSTKSRLSGMGDLSIVIEDESNMIDLWDFSGNPAGFLEDEKGSIVRSDFFWEPYRVRDIVGSPSYFDPRFKFESNGDIIHGWMSMDMRKDSNYAIGVAGSYFARQASFFTADYELTHPDIFMVFCKQLNPSTYLGADLTYVEYTSETKPKSSQITTQSKTHYVRVQIGGERKLSNEILLAVLLGYDSIDSGKKFYTSDYYTFWASFHSIVQISDQLKLGLESVSYLRRANYEHSFTGGNQQYFFTTFRLRGIYNLTTKLHLGMFYSDNEISTDFFHPLESFIYPISPDGIAVSHMGFGISYQITDGILAGAEYHIKNSSHPHSARPDWGYTQESWNLGIESTVLNPLIFRIGYIRSATDRNPVAWLRTESCTRENAATLGIGYNSSPLNLGIDFSYRYSFKKFVEWYINWDAKARSHLLSISVKKTF